MAPTAVNHKSLIKEWVFQARAEAEQDNYLGKRLMPRFAPWSEPLELRAGGKIINAQGRDISLQGVGFTCKQQLRRGEDAEIRPHGESVWIPIRVQHCTLSVGVYKVGAKFRIA